MPVLFGIIGILVWIVIPDEVTKPVDEAIQGGLKKLVGYLKKGPKKPYEE
jgi:hypothetical protein